MSGGSVAATKYGANRASLPLPDTSTDLRLEPPPSTLLVAAQWRAAFGATKHYKFGTVQPLTGVAASGGKTALVGVQMAVDQINKSGGIMGRPVELIVGDDQSKPDTGRRAVEKLVSE